MNAKIFGIFNLTVVALSVLFLVLEVQRWAKDDRNDDVTRSNSSQFYLDNGQLHKIDEASFVIRNFVINISLLTLLFTIGNLICLTFSLRTSQSLEVGKAGKIIRILTLVIFILVCIAVILEHVTIFLDKLEIIKKKWQLFVASIFLGFAIILTFVLAIAVLIYFLRKKLASKRGIKGVDCPDVRSGSETTPQAPPTTSSRGVPSLDARNGSETVPQAPLRTSSRGVPSPDARNCSETAPQVPPRTSSQGLPCLPKARVVETGEGVCSPFQLYLDENAGNVNGAFVGTLTRSKQLPINHTYCSINHSPQNVKKHTKSQPGSAQFHVNVTAVSQSTPLSPNSPLSKQTFNESLAVSQLIQGDNLVNTAFESDYSPDGNPPKIISSGGIATLV